ncbi:hypothetical protein [Streptomyces sp. NPDC002845]
MSFTLGARIGHVLVVDALLGAKSSPCYGNRVHVVVDTADDEVRTTARALADCCRGAAYVGRWNGLPAAIVIGSDGVVWGLSLLAAHEVAAGPEV